MGYAGSCHPTGDRSQVVPPAALSRVAAVPPARLGSPPGSSSVAVAFAAVRVRCPLAPRHRCGCPRSGSPPDSCSKKKRSSGAVGVGRVRVRHRRATAGLERARSRCQGRQPASGGSPRQRRALTPVSTCGCCADRRCRPVASASPREHAATQRWVVSSPSDFVSGDSRALQQTRT